MGAANQAAWAITGTMPDWPVPYVEQHDPTVEETAAADELEHRYSTLLYAHSPARHQQ